MSSGSEVSNRQDDLARYREIFNRLDVDKDGLVDVSELQNYYVQRHIVHSRGQADAVMKRTDTDHSGNFNFDEFVKYMDGHERALREAFTRLDRDRDGMIDSNEVQKAFAELGIHVSIDEVQSLMNRMKKDGRIDYETWRNFFLLQPSTSLRNMMRFWHHSVAIDVGEDSVLPEDFTEEELKTGVWWRSLLAGGLAGAVSRTCTAPLDRLKVLMQVYGNKHKDMTIISGLRHMVREGGWMSLWRGNLINVIKIAPESAIKFFAYEQFKGYIKAQHQDKSELMMGERFLAGSLAGITSQSVIYPLEVLKTRLTVRKTGEYGGVKDCIRDLYRAQGVRAFYRGYVPNAIGIIPYAGIDLCIYETLKTLYTTRAEALNNGQKQDTPVTVMLACGALSSTCGQLASYPLALIRTRLQAHPHHVSESSWSVMLGNILRKEGVRGLYRGLAPNFLKVAPAVSISYAVYEEARRALGISAM